MLERLLVVALITAAPVASANKSPTLGDLRRVGAAHIDNSCSEAAQPDLRRALALLHSFFYQEARRGFLDVAKRDPTCALAQWGVAMTHWHPLWTPPSDEEREQGLAAALQAQKLGPKKDVERGLVRAILAYYRAPKGGGEGGQTCHGPTGDDVLARARAYEHELEALFRAHPNDVEVGAFYALALLGTAPPTDKTYANQKKATAILERFWKKHPDHPGLAHYLIHGYDYPELAEKGLPAARAYAAIAPWVPHVLHMPSHIFTRLGMWPDVVASNLASADAGRQYAAREHPQAASFEELHALDYLAYAYLQRGDDDAAKIIADRVAAVDRTVPEIDFAVSYATGAVPARYVLERRDWQGAAALQVPARVTWTKMPFGEAAVELARGLGAARLKRVDDARRAALRLDAIAAATSDPRFSYFQKQVRMQANVVRGWTAYAEGRPADAEKLLRAAADEDDLLGKHPVSPGSLLPAREVLADFLLETGRPKEALVEYRATLRLNPDRLNALAGAIAAAQKAGDSSAARAWAEKLVESAAPFSTRAEILAAKGLLARR